MNRTLTLTIFFGLFAAGVFLVHYYLWKRLIKNTELRSKKFFTIVLVILGLSFPVSFALAKIIPFSISFYLLWFGNLWLGMMLLYLFSFLFIDFLRLFIYTFNKFFKKSNTVSTENTISRRKFISKSVAMGVSGVVFGATALSIKKYYDKAVVKKIKIKIKNLPDSFKNFKIVQISDIHIGQIMRKDTLTEIVRQVNELKPDMVAITGDLADGETGFLFDEITPLKDLKAKYGVFFVTGNHEYYSGAEQWIKAVKKLGIVVLENAKVEIVKNNQKITIIGTNDREGGRFGKKNAPDFKKAFKGVKKEQVKIFLTHQPPDVENASEYNVDLMLAGHTHGGQIWPFGYIVKLQQKYLKGYFKYKDTQLYVNQGTGCWGPPMRLGTENEITEITLS